jgi:hypothetical protein
LYADNLLVTVSILKTFSQAFSNRAYYDVEAVRGNLTPLDLNIMDLLGNKKVAVP